MRYLLFLLLFACDGDPEESDDPDTDTPASEDTWSDFAEDFFNRTCAGCHSDPGRDFRVYDDVVAHSEDIRCVISLDPPASCTVSHVSFNATDEERDRLEEWILGGMEE